MTGQFQGRRNVVRKICRFCPPQPPPEKAGATRDPSSSRPASRPHAVGHLEGREQVGESLADLLLGEEAYVRLFFLLQRRQPERPILPLSPLLHEDSVATAERVQREADPALLGTPAHGAVSVIAQHSSAPSGEACLAEELAPLGPGTGPRPLSVLHPAIRAVRHATLSPENLHGESIRPPKSRGHSLLLHIMHYQKQTKICGRFCNALLCKSFGPTRNMG